jgi:hypothetical protein
MRGRFADPVLRTFLALTLLCTTMPRTALGQGASWSITEDDVQWQELPPLLPEALGKALLDPYYPMTFPPRFSLAEEHGYCFSPSHGARQGEAGEGCGVCNFFAATHALEIETKRTLIADYGLGLSAFNVNLSEMHLIEKYKSEYSTHNLSITVPSRLARKGWVIPLEYDKCYSWDDCDFPLSPPQSFSEGVRVMEPDRYRICFFESGAGDIKAIKEALFWEHKGVIVSICVPADFDWVQPAGFDWLESETAFKRTLLAGVYPPWDEPNHTVCIIGWNDTAKVLEAGAVRDLGPAWIVRNSWGPNAHHNPAAGHDNSCFYLKMGEKVASKVGFYTLGKVSLVNHESFITRLHGSGPFDCEGNALSYEGWCGPLVAGETRFKQIRNPPIRKVNRGTRVYLAGYEDQAGNVYAAGWYTADTYLLADDIAYMGTGLRVVPSTTVGSNETRASFLDPWAQIIHTTEAPGSAILNHTATVGTYVHHILCILNGQNVRTWVPCLPENASIGLSFIYPAAPGCENPYGYTAIRADQPPLPAENPRLRTVHSVSKSVTQATRGGKRAALGALQSQ